MCDWFVMNRRLHEVIEIIYDSSLNPDKWSELICGVNVLLSSEMGSDYFRASSHVDVSGHAGDSSKDDFQQDTNASSEKIEIARLLNGHFERAVKILDANSTAIENRHVLENVFDKLSMPVLIVNREKEVVCINEEGTRYVSDSELFDVKDDVLLINDVSLYRAIDENLKKAISKNAVQLFSLGLPGMGASPSMTIVPLDENRSASEQNAALFISAPHREIGMTEQEMKSLYKITKAETRLINYLLKGYTVKEVSCETGLSMATIRAQLRSVFEKTETSRQAELIQLMLLKNSNLHIRKDAFNPKTKLSDPKRELSRTIKLRDGRTLGFSEYGDLDGVPMIGCHPITGCRLQNHPNERITRSLGVRLIVPDRPGFGLSSPLRERNYSDWAKDVGELLDHLNIDDAMVLGYCGGAPFAISCAIELHERIKKLILVSPVTPYDKIDLLFGLSSHNRMFVNIASQLPNSIYKIGQIFARGVVRNPERYFDEIINNLCATDAAALNEPEFMKNFSSALSESLRQGPHEFTYEQLLLANDWGLNMSKVPCETHIWHGDQDKHVPVEYAKKFYADFPSARFHLIPDYGHFLIYYFWENILATAIRQ